MMTYHSEDGRHFLGCRRSSRGDLEIVYDEVGGHRVVFHLAAPDPSEPLVRMAMRKALTQRNVVAALYSELTARKIAIETGS